MLKVNLSLCFYTLAIICSVYFFVQGESASPKKVIIKDQAIGESQTVTPHSTGVDERTGEGQGSLQITNEGLASLGNCGSM